MRALETFDVILVHHKQPLLIVGERDFRLGLHEPHGDHLAEVRLGQVWNQEKSGVFQPRYARHTHTTIIFKMVSIVYLSIIYIYSARSISDSNTV